MNKPAPVPAPRASRSGRRPFFFWLLPLLAVVGSACTRRELPQNAWSPVGPMAEQLDNLAKPVFAVAGVVLVLVTVLVVYASVRFRSRSDDEAPRQVHGNTKAEIAWTIAPAAVLAVIGVFTVATIIDINRRAEGADVLDVEVVGHQWWWEFRYPDGEVTANELHVPVGRTVQVDMTSTDVIHSFWVPKLAGKVDVVPGRSTTLNFIAPEPGRYSGQCAEYCGLSHANMRLVVVAHEEDEYADWLALQSEEAAEPADGTLAAEGRTLVQQRGCGGCHAIAGLEGMSGQVGPDLTHFAGREVFAGAIFETTEPNLRRWLRDPPAMKPMMPDDGIGMPDLGLTEDDITAIIAYLETLS